jgi:hypothetical protein
MSTVDTYLGPDAKLVGYFRNKPSIFGSILTYLTNNTLRLSNLMNLTPDSDSAASK